MNVQMQLLKTDETLAALTATSNFIGQLIVRLFSIFNKENIERKVLYVHDNISKWHTHLLVHPTELTDRNKRTENHVTASCLSFITG